MTLIAIFLLAYLFVAPDKGTLAATRGTEGAFRAVLGMPPRQRRAAKGSAGKASTGSKITGSAGGSSSGGGGSRSLRDGWREGVASARVAREEGRDAWARTSRGAGRVAGGTRNVVDGIRTTYRTRRDRRQGSTTAPGTQTTVIDPTTDPASVTDHQGDDVTDQRPVEWPASFKRAADVSGDGTLLFSSKDDDLGAAIGKSAKPEPWAGGLDELVEDQVPDLQAPGEVVEKPAADPRYYVWESPDSGQFFVFDRMNLDEPLPCSDERAAELWTGFYNDRHGLATQDGQPATALSDLPGRGGPYDPFTGMAPESNPMNAYTPTLLANEDDQASGPWPIVLKGPRTKTCSRCGNEMTRVEDSFDADKATSTWSNTYHCPGCSTEELLVKTLTPNERSWIFPETEPLTAAQEAAVTDLATSLAGAVYPTSQIPTADLAAGNTNPRTTLLEGTTPMSIAGTELANLDEVAGEANAALNAIEALTEALSEIKGWAGNLPDRWSGTSWSTDNLDAAITGTAEAAQELKVPEALMEQLAAISQAVKEARTVGEIAAETGAKGDLSGFRGN